MQKIKRLLFLTIGFGYTPIAMAEDTDYHPTKPILYQINAGFIQAQNDASDTDSQRVLGRVAYPGISMPSFSKYRNGLQQIRILRTNASGEFHVQDWSLQAYNIDADILGANIFFGDAGGAFDIRLALGYIQLFHDQLMGENYDRSIKLIDIEGRGTLSALPNILGLGFNVLGFQEREYQDGTVLRVLDIIGLRGDIGIYWENSNLPMEWSLSAEGDIGFADAMIYDTKVDAKYTIHLPVDKVSLRIQAVATHQLHYNGSRGNPTDTLIRIGGQAIIQYK